MVANAESAGSEFRAELKQGISRFIDGKGLLEDRLEAAWPELPEASRATGLALARLVSGLAMDERAVAAAFVYGASDGDVDRLADPKDPKMLADVISMAEGVLRMDAISRVRTDGSLRENHEGRVEAVRRMLINMVDDVRIVVIRLAAQLELLRNLKGQGGEYRDAVAAETLEIFAPLANRLGIWQLKWELEDLAFRYLNGDTYREIAGKLAERRDDRRTYIDEYIRLLGEAVADVNVDAEISGRPKHIYSIWRKMQRKNLEFDHVLDVRAVRVLVREIGDCYAVLGAVHQLWPHVSGEFDDYIATPKENNYRSIHTAIIGPQGKIVEVQIRTGEMHEENELGIAAHWRYKEGAGASSSLDRKVLWLRHLLEWKEEISTTSDFIDSLKQDAVDERVYVFTPAGGVIDLPRGATPVDFAYAVHTEVGHRCRGAKVGGRIVSLDHALDSGDQVEIITGNASKPSRDWLSSTLGYTKTSRARSRIARWFKEQNFDDNVTTGRTALEREIDRLGLRDVGYDPLAQEHGFKRVDDFLAAIGSGDLRASQAVSSLRQQLEREEEPKIEQTPARARARRSARGLEVQGVGNLMHTMATCCAPVPGDRIVGYVTRSKGVSIHRADCHNALELNEREPERVLLVNWGEDSDETFPVDVSVVAFDRQGLIRDISAAFADAGVNVLGINSRTDRDSHTAHMTITIEIANIGNMSEVLARILRIPNVTEARRVSH